MTEKLSCKTIYPFNVVSDEVFNVLTESECVKIVKNEKEKIAFYQENTPNHTQKIELKDDPNLIAYTKLANFRNRQKVIQVYYHNFNPFLHSAKSLQKLIKKIKKLYKKHDWIGVHINLPVNYPIHEIDEKLAHVHCRYFLGRVKRFNIQLPENYTIKIPSHSFDLIDQFETMNRDFKFKNPYAENWEETLWFDHWLNTGKSAVIYNAKNHSVAGVFMTYMKEFVFSYPTWQIQFVITDSTYQRKGLARILRKYASNMAFDHPSNSSLIGGIVGLWNTPSIKNFDVNGRLPCLDRVLIDRDENTGYPRSKLN